MPVDQLIANADLGVDNGVWQQGRPLFQYFNDIVPGDVYSQPNACSGAGSNGSITAASVTAAQYDWSAFDLPAGRASVNFIQSHAGGRQAAVGAPPAQTIFRFRTNDGAGPTITLDSYTSVEMPNILFQNVFGPVITINPDTGQAFLVEHLRRPYARFSLDTNGCFLCQRRICHAHIHADTNLDSQGILETIGASWIPPLLAALDGGLNLYSESWPKLHHFFWRGVLGCDPAVPAPSRVNREERQWILDHLFVRPSFVFLGR